MYRLYADGRHEGLLDIDEDAKQEFSDWIDGKHPKRTSGGHPWEIKRRVTPFITWEPLTVLKPKDI
jgi:hypothetical protein